MAPEVDALTMNVFRGRVLIRELHNRFKKIWIILRGSICPHRHSSTPSTLSLRQAAISPFHCATCVLCR